VAGERVERWNGASLVRALLLKSRGGSDGSPRLAPVNRRAPGSILDCRDCSAGIEAQTAMNLNVAHRVAWAISPPTSGATTGPCSFRTCLPTMKPPSPVPAASIGRKHRERRSRATVQTCEPLAGRRAPGRGDHRSNRTGSLPISRGCRRTGRPARRFRRPGWRDECGCLVGASHGNPRISCKVSRRLLKNRNGTEDH